MSYILPLFIAVPLLAAFLIMPHARLHRRLPDIICLAVTAFLLAASISFYFTGAMGNLSLYYVAGFVPPAGINLVLDGLSGLMLLIISFGAFIISIYSISYMDKFTHREYFSTLLMFMVAGMNGVVLTGDLLNLFIFLELASIASAALVAFGTEAEEMEAAFKYLMMGSIASMLLLFGIAIVYAQTGTLNMADASRLLYPAVSHVKMFIIMLFLAGFCTKAAVAPFHAWLPDAHPSAPAPISAMLSGILIKSLGIYTITRIMFNVMGMTYEVSLVLMWLGAFSIIVGSFLALSQWDIKRLLACSTISQVGYMVLAIGLASPMGVMGGLLHMLNHSIIKPLLFLNAGSVEYSTGTRDMKQLGGLGSRMPVTWITSLFGSLSLSGIPPFNGFWSKLLIIIACVQSGKFFFAAVAVVGSIMTLTYMLKFQQNTFFGIIPEKLHNIRKTPLSMALSMVTLALFCLLFGVLFQFVIAIFINPAVVTVASGLSYSRMILGGMQ